MKNLINTNHPLQIEGKIIKIRSQNVILDRDVAAIYGVETKRVNEAIKNNPKKFPNEEYVFDLTKQEWHDRRALLMLNNSKSKNSVYLVENFDQISTNNTKSATFDLETLKSTVLPKAFTEKGLYMLATILKSDQATDATIEIIETFAKLKQLQSNLATLEAMEPEILETEVVEKVVEKTGGLFEELFFTGTSTSAKTSIGVNLGIISLKREITAEKNPPRPSNSEFDELKTMIEELKEQNKQLLKKH